MAFDAYDDYEQSERVQKWLRQNGLSIVAGVVIGLVAIFGWQQWRKHQANHQAEAAQLYDEIQAAAAVGMNTAVDSLAAELQKDFADTPYALFAATDQAQQLVQAHQLDKALIPLTWAEQHATDPALKALTQLRIARVQLARGDTAQALAALDRMPPKSYEALSEELRGDVLVKVGRPDDARKAYEAAKAALGGNAQQGGDLQMKIDDLAVAGKQGA